MRVGIRFEFDQQKAIGVMAYILTSLGRLDKIKLIKMIYLSDRECFLSHGHPITGDRQCAMRSGPVPSACLDLLNANMDSDRVFVFLHVDDNKVEIRDGAPEAPGLTDEEKEVLDRVIEEYGAIPTWKLVGLTHGFPEYREAYEEDTSTTIPYEQLLKHYGSADQYRHNRPVVSRKMAERMVSPFLGSEPDL